MASKNGVNADMVKGPVGKNSTRINPVSFARNNMSKGGVNKDPLIKADMTKLPSKKA